MLIPTCDRAEILDTVLPSYLQECVTKVVIVDDASDDDTFEVASRWAMTDPRVAVVRNEIRLGQPASRNRGLEMTETAFIFFGEDDVELPMGYLERLVSIACEHSAVIVGSGLRFLPYALRTSPDRWSGAASPLPSLGLGHEERRGIDEGVVAVPHVHGVFLARLAAIHCHRFSPAYRGNAFREESDFQIRVAGSDGLILGDTSQFFIHYQRPVHLARTGNSRVSPLVYEYWAARNNAHFLRSNEALLRDRGMLRGPRVAAQARFVVCRTLMFVRARLRRARHAALPWGKTE